jgi:carboxymethylenebutenolidase
VSEMIQFENDGVFDAYLVRPAPGVACKGGLVLIHEIWGLSDHIKDVAERFGSEGYVVVAPDLLSRVGMTAHLGAELEAIMHSTDEKVRTDAQPRLREAMAPGRSPEFAEWAVPSLVKCVDFLAADEEVGGRIAVVGFCFGGSFSFALSSVDPRLRAAIPFYGTPPAMTEYDSISMPVLAFYGDLDERLMESLPDVTRSMEAADVDFETVVYKNAGHAFFNDTNEHAFVPDAAEDAWLKSLDFLDSHL